MARSEEFDTEVPFKKKVDDLYKLIEGIEIAMFTTPALINAFAQLKAAQRHRVVPGISVRRAHRHVFCSPSWIAGRPVRVRPNRS